MAEWLTNVGESLDGFSVTWTGGEFIQNLEIGQTATFSFDTPAVIAEDSTVSGYDYMVSTSASGFLLSPALPGSIGDTVWFDANDDGLQSTGELGMPGVAVTLFISDGTTLTATTDSKGHYQFDGLDTDKMYGVQFANPNAAIYRFTTTSLYGPFPLSPGEYKDTVDAGLTTDEGIVYGRAWHDENGDGIQDTGEDGIENDLVELVPRTGAIQTTHTDKNGNYRFVPVASGEYRVKFAIPGAGDRFSPADQGDNDNVDSDVVDPDGFTSPFLINAQTKKKEESKGEKCVTDATPAQKAIFETYLKWAAVPGQSHLIR